MGTRHPAALKLAVVSLARLDGVDEAARAAKVDVRTVRIWVEAAVTDHPSVQDWQASRNFAKSQELRAAFAGDPNLAFAWSKSAGVGQRNLNFELQIARAAQAQAGTEEEAPADSEPAWVTALDELDEPRGRLFGAEVWAELTRRSEFEDPRPLEADVELDAILLPQIKRLAALTDDEVRDQLLALEPGWAVHYGWEIPASAEPEPSDLPSGPLDPPQPAPGPSQRPVQAARPPNPGAQVVTAEEQREYESQRQLWRLYGALRGRPA